MTSTENRRRLRNFLLDKPVQYRYGLYFFLVSVMAAVVSQVLMLRSAETLVLGTLSAGVLIRQLSRASAPRLCGCWDCLLWCCCQRSRWCRSSSRSS